MHGGMLLLVRSLDTAALLLTCLAYMCRRDSTFAGDHICQYTVVLYYWQYPARWPSHAHVYLLSRSLIVPAASAVRDNNPTCTCGGSLACIAASPSCLVRLYVYTSPLNNWSGTSNPAWSVVAGSRTVQHLLPGFVATICPRVPQWATGHSGGERWYNHSGGL